MSPEGGRLLTEAATLSTFKVYCTYAYCCRHTLTHTQRTWPFAFCNEVNVTPLTGAHYVVTTQRRLGHGHFRDSRKQIENVKEGKGRPAGGGEAEAKKGK